jgi:glycosyltransferase involved in cell wall biosynthesis
MSTPFFSVIIPTYNREILLREALNSVFSQTFEDYEVIVVDDGSTDGTLEMLQSYGDKIQILTQKNAGPGGARNLGASLAKGEYLAFLDSDDLWLPWALCTFYRSIKNHKNPSLSCSSIYEFSDKKELKSITEEPLHLTYFHNFFESWRSHSYVGAGMAVIRKNTFLACEGFTTKIKNCEDHDLILRLGFAPGFISIKSPMTLGWRRHEGSTTMNVKRSIDGVLYLIIQENSGRYPGGQEYSHHRIYLISSHARPVSLECLRSGARSDAWKLYCKTFFWNLRLCRFNYLIGFPIKAFFS